MQKIIAAALATRTDAQLLGDLRRGLRTYGPADDAVRAIARETAARYGVAEHARTAARVHGLKYAEAVLFAAVCVIAAQAVENAAKTPAHA